MKELIGLAVVAVPVTIVIYLLVVVALSLGGTLDALTNLPR
jgi:hypothetical protein